MMKALLRVAEQDREKMAEVKLKQKEDRMREVQQKIDAMKQQHQERVKLNEEGEYKIKEIKRQKFLYQQHLEQDEEDQKEKERELQ
jgi:hypothetical protein